MPSALATTHQLALFNVARLAAPLESAQLQAFMAGLDPINALAERAPGFVWRYTVEGSNNSTAAQPLGDDVLINFAVWASREALWDFVYRSEHLDFLRRRRQWFRPMSEPYLVLWWVPTGHIPPMAEALERLQHLRRKGPTPAAFTFRTSFDPPARPDTNG